MHVSRKKSLFNQAVYLVLFLYLRYNNVEEKLTGVESVILVFFRHGDAEDAGEFGEDSARKLTEKGAKRTRRMGKMMTKLIPGKCRLHIWSSPLIRATATAEILSERWGVKIKIHQAVASGDFEALTPHLALCQQEDCVVIVGHQPFLSEWTNHLTGINLNFRKSAAAAIRYEPAQKAEEGELLSELLWYVQPNFSKVAAKMEECN